MFQLQIIVMDKVVDDTNIIKTSVLAIFNMTWDNSSAIMKLFFVLVKCYLMLTSVLDSKVNTQNRHFLPGLAKIELVSKMSHC